jgi:uncharacterized repeat protein (TIGR01451 family)
MAKPLTPLEQKQLSAFLEIIPNTDIHLVQEALDTGFYRGVSLNEAKEFLLEHEDFKSLKDSLTGSTAYSRPEFEEFLKKIKTHPNGLYDRLKKALWNNDRDILDPSSSPKDSVNTASGELTPPHALEKEAVTPVTPPTFGPIAASTSGGELKSATERGEEQENEEVNEAPQALSDQGHEKLNRINRSMQQTKTGLSQSTPTTGEPLQRMSTRLNSANRSLQRSTPTTLGRAKARRSALISSQTRRKVAAGAMLGSGGGGAASSGLLGNLLGARSGLQLLKSALSRFGFNGAASWIGKLLPEKLLAQGLRGLWNLGSSFGRAAFDGLIKNAFNLAPRGLSAFGGGGAGSFLTGAGATAAAVVSTAAFWWIAAILILGTILFWSVYDVNTECGQPGKVELIKTANKEAFEAGEEIQYTISLNYNIKCNSAYLDRVIVRDTLSPDLTYTPNSARSTKTMEVIDPTQIQDSTSINEPGSVELPPQIDPNFPAADNITLDGNTIVWQLGKVTSNYPVTMTFSATPNQSNIWIPNQATAGYRIVSVGSNGTSSGSGDGTVIDSNSLSFQQAVNQAAQKVGMEPALLKAFLRVEAPQSLKYSEEEFSKFSTPGWWEGLEANAGSLAGNDATVIRGYAYNTCAYTSCAPGADVRGIAQFELKTWNGVASQLSFSDGHQPDRRNATDAIFGSALHNRQNAEIYTGSPNVQWTEDVIKAAARVYCAGPAAARNPARIRDSACMAGGVTYDDLVWNYYLEFSGQQ